MFFITLSCAEYHWPDISRLLIDRLKLGGKEPEDYPVNPSDRGFVKLVNQYSIVVQEYFQKRVVLWLETAGKELFGIDHYWVRYEFAPGRGQIHAHLFAMSEDIGIFEQMAQDGKTSDGTKAKALRLAKYAEERLGMTASVAGGFDEIPVSKDGKGSPMRL